MYFFIEVKIFPSFHCMIQNTIDNMISMLVRLLIMCSMLGGARSYQIKIWGNATKGEGVCFVQFEIGRSQHGDQHLKKKKQDKGYY